MPFRGVKGAKFEIDNSLPSMDVLKFKCGLSNRRCGLVEVFDICPFPFDVLEMGFYRDRCYFGFENGSNVCVCAFFCFSYCRNVARGNVFK